jgi:ribosomal protein S18 acetylase RimI-like enzyme
VDYCGSSDEDLEIRSLLTCVFVDGGFTDWSDAETMFVSAALQDRGEIILARSVESKLLGMIIFVRPTSSARQVAEMNEAEIQLLAVYPEARNQGIASQLILVCEQRAISSGYSKMVLSTQQMMKEAHHIYEKLGYHRNPSRNWSRKGTNKIYFVYEKVLRY